jgi:hypothetical protein
MVSNYLHRKNVGYIYAPLANFVANVVYHECNLWCVNAPYKTMTLLQTYDITI